MTRRLAGLVRRHLGVDRLSAELQTSERNIERGVLYASRRPVGERYRYLLANFVAVNLSFAAWHPWNDAAAALLVACALLLVESGVLVWPLFVAAYALGVCGVSKRGIVALTALLAFHLYLRFGPLAIGTPALGERPSGYGFSLREPDELVRMFGASPVWFYAYNVICSVLTVLLSEPCAGVWELTRNALHEGFRPWQLIHFMSSACATLLIARFVWMRLPRWRLRELTDDDRLFLLFGAVLLGNAAISFAYTKDVIMSPAGVFYALALFVAAKDLLERFRQAVRPPIAGVMLAAVLLVLSVGWSLRAVGLYYNLRNTAFVHRNDWAGVDEYLERKPYGSDPQVRQTVDRLRREALAMPVPSPYFAQPWAERYFDQH